MSIDELCALPVKRLAEKDCLLFLWATFPQLPEALRLIKAWGFNYKSVAFVWLKKNKKADSWFYGLGFWTRGNAEIFPSWAICPVWSCSPVRPRPAGMYGATRWSRQSGTSGQFVPRKECDGCPM